MRVTKPIWKPEFWRERLERAPQRHQAVFVCPLELWRRIEAKHREILARTIGEDDCVLDAGCAWGRLLDLMPPAWKGCYVGVDLSPDFVALAREEHPGRTFLVADLRDCPVWGFDWAVMISIRPMIRREMGEEVWLQVERRLRRCARKLLFLEYDPDDPGSVE